MRLDTLTPINKWREIARHLFDNTPLGTEAEQDKIRALLRSDTEEHPIVLGDSGPELAATPSWGDYDVKYGIICRSRFAKTVAASVPPLS